MRATCVLPPSSALSVLHFSSLLTTPKTGWQQALLMAGSDVLVSFVTMATQQFISMDVDGSFVTMATRCSSEEIHWKLIRLKKYGWNSYVLCISMAGRVSFGQMKLQILSLKPSVWSITTWFYRMCWFPQCFVPSSSSSEWLWDFFAFCIILFIPGCCSCFDFEGKLLPLNVFQFPNQSVCPLILHWGKIKTLLAMYSVYLLKRPLNYSFHFKSRYTVSTSTFPRLCYNGI